MHHSSSPGSSKKHSCTPQKSITPKRIRTLYPMKHSPASFSANDNTTSSNPEDDDTTIVNEKTTTCTQYTTEQTKDLLRKLYQFFLMEKGLKRPWMLQNPMRRLVKATGIKQSTLRGYINGNDPVQDVVKSIHKDYVQKTVTKTQKVDDFDKGVVRRTIYDLHKKSQSVTMPKLQEALKKKDIDISISTVSRTVHLLGFRFYKNATSRRFVSEREDIVLMRMTYLRKIHKFRQQGRHIVYLDETWLNTNHVVKGDWLDVPSTSMSVFEPHCKGTHRKVPSGKGTRLIILDVGSSQQGLIPGCGLIFESKTNSSDYHDEMNKEHFTEWFRDTLLPKLPPRSVIVMDNAPYHSHLDPDSKVPNTNSNKSEISAWLEKSNVQYDKKMKKTELLDLVKQKKPQPRYIIDDLASANGHEILRTPPYHCELNPIELVWSYLKGYVARNNSSCNKKGITQLFLEAKSHVDAERWAKFETRVVREFEEKLRKLDGIRDEDVNPVVIDMTDDDSDDSQKTIPYMFSEGEGEGTNENDVDFEDSVPDTINDADEILCNTCGSTEPPKSIQKDKYISWFQCDTCDQWVHNRCCTKPALARNVCLRCFSILNHRNLSEPLISPIEDMEQ
ncbi:unnamed protein product [Mytilus edulis]|uniref:Tc1-like transposase DDE domain-containing protein n=1 Tax=Mytilus edulis TaxID=6550 RepID=A0A8S3QXM1_MYTED|nr:unnamed protein product [Mytilus edulis]